MTQIGLTTTGAWFALTFILLPIFLYVFVSALYRSNRRYFEAFQIAPIVQEMLRTCDPQNAFLALNLRSIIFNLGQGKWWTGKWNTPVRWKLEQRAVYSSPRLPFPTACGSDNMVYSRRWEKLWRRTNWKIWGTCLTTACQCAIYRRAFLTANS